MADLTPTEKPADIINRVGIDSLIERIAAGEQQIAIADSLGISDAILSYHLKRHPQHESAIESHHRRRMDQVDGLHDKAVDERDFDLARAREGQAKRVYHRASLECKAFQKQHHLSVTGAITADHTLKTDIGSLLDAVRMPVANTANSPIDGESERILAISPTSDAVSD